MSDLVPPLYFSTKEEVSMGRRERQGGPGGADGGQSTGEADGAADVRHEGLREHGLGGASVEAVRGSA